MIGSDLIREVAQDLNDLEPNHEFTRWSRDQLQSYLREALSIAGSNLKSRFTRQVVLEVKPGAAFQKACECTEIVRIFGECTSQGLLLKTLRRVDDIDEINWVGGCNSQSCTKEYCTCLVSFTLSRSNPSEYKVYPPLRHGAHAYVLAECYIAPDGDYTRDIPADLVAMVKAWMLYRALSVDAETSPAVAQAAASHRTDFFDMLKINITLDEKDEEERRRRMGLVVQMEKSK